MTFSLAGTILVGIAVMSFLTAATPLDDQIATLLKNQSPLLSYPTDYTRDIFPRRIHSHNDYWRQVPLLTALSYGCASVEADVWLVDDTLYVGHDRASLTDARTFKALYIDPLVSILDKANPKTKFTEGITSLNGVFDVDPGTTLQFLVDIKTNGDQTLPFVLKALEPLRSKGYLTTFENGTIRRSVITVVGTGASPLEAIEALSPRDYFFDAPLATLTDTSQGTTWTPELSPLASTDWQVAVGWSGIGDISGDQLSKLEKLVKDAHDRSITARFWNLPVWPNSIRDAIWNQLIKSGVDWLNADDLRSAALVF